MPYINQRFNSATTEWSTPDTIFKPLDNEFHFTLDVCASKENTKCKQFFSIEQDSLNQEWYGICWMNPPYGNSLYKWIKKAYYSSLNGTVVVGLLPVRTNTGYWHDYILNIAEVRYIRGYPKFGDAKQGLKVPLAIVIWRKGVSLINEERNMKATLIPKVKNPNGLPVPKAVEWAEQLRDAVLRDDGEKLFVIIFRIWTEAQKTFNHKRGSRP